MQQEQQMQNWKVEPGSHVTAEAMICKIAGVCNGASTWDGAGFSKIDASFGHSLADRAIQNLPWTSKQAFSALKMLKKYQRQLGGSEFIDTWLLNPVFRRKPVDQLLSNTQNTSGDRRLYSRGQDAVLVFTYDTDLVAAIKTQLKGEHKGKKFWASWDATAKSWAVPVNETSIWCIIDLAEKFEFQIEDRFTLYIERVREKTAESRTMLAINDGRNVVLAGDMIMISVNNAAILEEFENELGTV